MNPAGLYRKLSQSQVESTKTNNTIWFQQDFVTCSHALIGSLVC